MAAPTTTTSFLDLLRRSNLLTEGALAEYLKAAPNADALSPTDLAGRLVRDAVLTQFQANHLLKGRYKNFFIGKFKVLEPLGSGGMSQVFLCEHAIMRHRVALKMLPIKESTDPAAVNRFLREARAAAAVNHPNVVRAHDFDQADGKFYYLIMDYVDGVNLHDLVAARGPLPPAEAANYIAQTAAGLQHICENGLIHRDLKPSNLLLDRAGVVRILDLGLARFTDDDGDNITRQFQANTIMGTADYLAPEQAMMMDGVDIRADVYSLGATFYFLLSGKAPFESSSVTQKLLAHQMREPEELAGVPADVRNVVRKMMAKKPADRFQEPADVIEALAEWLAEPLPPPDESVFPRRSGAAGPATGGPRPAPPPSTRPGPKDSSATRIGLHTPPPHVGANSGSLSDILSARSSRMPRPALPSEVPQKPRRKWLLPVAVAGGLAAVAAAVIAVGNPFKTTPAPAPPAGSGPTAAKKADPVVPPAPAADAPPPPADGIAVGVGGRFPTVAAALRTAPAGAKIFLLDDPHTEPPLAVTAPLANIRVSGWPETRPVRWKPAADAAPNLPLVAVANAPGFTLANVAFDGDGRCGTAVTFGGACPGAGLDGVTVMGCLGTAVTVTGGHGEQGRELSFRRFRAVGGAGGLRLTAGENAPTRHVLVDNSRFDGPMSTGLELVGAATGVTVSFSRFVGARDGVRLSGQAGSVFDLTLKNCTFANGFGAAVSGTSLPNPASKIAVTDSLFYKCGRILRFANVPAAPPAVWVWHDGDPPVGTRYFRRSVPLTTAPEDSVIDVGCVGHFKVWVNGTEVGKSPTTNFDSRVRAFPVGKALMKTGENVIAVEAARDPELGSSEPCGLAVRLSAKGAAVPFGATDARWRSSTEAAGGWRTAGFDDRDWKPVRVWDKPRPGDPWTGAVWDSAVPAAFAPDKLPKFVLGGNVRDPGSKDGFPLSGCVRISSDNFGGLGMDPLYDATFFRTPKSSAKLNTLGLKGGPVGVP